MNNIFLIFIAILLVISGTLYFFYNRDVLGEKTENLFDACVPVNLRVEDVSANSFIVKWQTSEKCLGLVRYGDSIDSINYIAIGGSDNIATNNHKVQINNLSSSSVYYFIVSSDGVDYGIEGAPVIVNTEAF